MTARPNAGSKVGIVERGGARTEEKGLSRQHRNVPPRRVAGTLFVAGFAGLVALVAGSSVVARADSSAVAVDRQNYTVTTPGGVDPYNNDTTAIHVGVTAGSETADSFVHLELDALPGGAVPTGGVLTLKPVTEQKQAAQDNVNPTGAAVILEACVLATEQPVNFDPKNPPASDCPAATSVGKAQPDGSWTFDLAVLMARWTVHNTGAEIRPVPGDSPSENWSIGFDVSLTTATVDYTVPGQTATQTTQPTAPTTVIHSGGGVTAYVPPATATTTPAASPTPAPSTSPAPAAAAAVPAVPPSTTVAVTTTDALLAHWPLVLLGGLLLGAVLLARPLAAAGAAGAFKLGVLSQLRNHPRAFAVSAVAVAWCTTYSAYAAAVGPTATH
jgi:hypothetical protein